jgi:hypothetical protein
MHKPFPETCLRGLRKEEQMERDDNGKVWILGKAFEPSVGSRNDRLSQRRGSDHYETSINWEDNPARPFEILCKDNKNACYGIVSIRLVDLTSARRQNPLAATSFEWERQTIRGNPFHGNLLFSGTLPMRVVRELAGVVATHVQPHMRFIDPADFITELAERNDQAKGDRSHVVRIFRQALSRVRVFFRVR